MSSTEEPITAEHETPLHISTTRDEKYGVLVDENTRNEISRRYPDHVYQELGSGWCGPAAISRIFKKLGHKMDQSEIATTLLSDGKPLYVEDWGSPHERMEEYLGIHFDDPVVLKDTNIETLNQYLKDGYEIIVNVRQQDDLDEDGHYVGISKIDMQNQLVEIYDSTNAIREDGLHGVYKLSFDKFNEEWWDYATADDEKNDNKTFHWAACVDPLKIKDSMIISAHD